MVHLEFILAHSCFFITNIIFLLYFYYIFRRDLFQNMSKGKQKMINLWAKQNIYFVPFTHILNRYVAKGVQSRNAGRR